MTLLNATQFMNMLIANKPKEIDTSVIPVNAKTRLPYQGNNIQILQEAKTEHGFTSAQWATFNQWNSLNERVRKGEKGTKISYFDFQEKIVDDKTEKVPFRKHAFVFNCCQLQSIDEASKK